MLNTKMSGEIMNSRVKCLNFNTHGMSFINNIGFQIFIPMKWKADSEDELQDIFSNIGVTSFIHFPIHKNKLKAYFDTN